MWLGGARTLAGMTLGTGQGVARRRKNSGRDAHAHVLNLVVHTVIFLAWWVGGSSQDILILTISTFLLEDSFILKSHEVGGGWCWPIRF